jgi:hypothetical protein
MAATTLPEITEVSRLFTDLSGRPAAAKRILPPAAPRGAMVVATYANDGGGRVGVFWLDLVAAASLAAALTLMSSGVADDSVRAGKLLDPLDENVREVLNICARLFSTPTSQRVFLRDVYLPPAKLPADLTALVARTQATLQAEVTITGYKVGKLGFFGA